MLGQMWGLKVDHNFKGMTFQKTLIPDFRYEYLQIQRDKTLQTIHFRDLQWKLGCIFHIPEEIA